ncbi:MAPEG family protein [Falsigemmobacter faecalis]|uniref:MAPEG family protein n=1 Tax=Falsigemmobacter faecalis TaxID=2488730 RepID=A0A3P3DNP3_9RHOB|nr:MAPEG family protein [Falsigemmobacter faecalis]RRH75867.1 MAPEG family protein [Falsigemmobacter faecalis]
MTPELTVLALGAILQMVQIAIAGAVMNKDVGRDWNTGARDREPDFSPLTGRLRRAVNNMFESLALFTIAVLVITLSEQSSGVTEVAAWIWLLARLLYFPAYGLGLSPWRSIVWAIGTIATLVILGVSLF